MTGFGDPVTLQVSLVVCPVFVVVSESNDSNTGGPVETHKYRNHTHKQLMNIIMPYNSEENMAKDNIRCCVHQTKLQLTVSRQTGALL